MEFANEEKFELYERFNQINTIDPSFYERYDVKRGLRNADGTGVLAGVTNISNVHGYVVSDGVKVADEGSLQLRGYELYDLIGAANGRRFRFEEIVYLLLMGELPTQDQLNRFVEVIDDERDLPDGFTASIVLHETPPDLMNILSRSTLLLYSYDMEAEDRSVEHEIHTALSLISRLPRIMVLAYYARQARYERGSMIMHPFIPGESTAETILSMLRPDRHYTPEEARMLDIMLCLHAEHGGGNNSTFTVRVTSSTRTDTYSSIAAGIGSLKGPLHGGANIKVTNMFHHLQENISDWKSIDEIDTYLRRMLNKEAYDKSGLIYGIGHAVYTKSDPRAVELKRLAGELAKEKGREEEYNFLCLLEQEGIKCLMEHRKSAKPACANLDFYSGFIYEMIGLPQEIYTPIFAMARIVGWMAHRIEELNFDGRRIIRPAYKNVLEQKAYVPIANR